MKLISWNVNGLRACVQKGFLDIFKELDADMFCIQESKLQEGQISLELEGYHQYWNYAIKKGYSGTAIFTRREPMSVAYGIGIEEHDQEGRVIDPAKRTLLYALQQIPSHRKAERMVFLSFSASTGFAICPFIPSANAFFLSSSNALAVIAMIGIQAFFSSASLLIV